MAEPALVSIPWLDDFERTPAEAVDDLLRGVADVSPYERAGTADVLVTLFGGLAEKDPGRLALDEALSVWLLARHGDGPTVRREHGMNRYVEELIQALTAVYRLRLIGTADRLRASFVSFQRWLRSLALGPGQDPALELWRIMALMQPDRRFLGDWFRLCEEAGHALSESYVTVGLLGLRRLPDSEGEEVEPGGRLGPEVVAGLFRWAARLPQGPRSRKAFQRQLGALKVQYPRAPQRWRDLMLPLLDAHPGAAFLNWLEGAGIKLERRGKRSSGVIPALPPRIRSDDLLRRLRNEPTERLIPEIRALVRDHERYAEATGDAENLVKTACHFSGRLRNRAPLEALRLARLARSWQPSNPYTWTQWAAALEILGKEDRAEVIYWEALRRFPDNPVGRVALADLLVRADRSDEAEGLLREAVDRFPDNAHSHVALAELLARTQRLEEAEGLLRRAADRFQDNAHCRVFLAEVLARTERPTEAERLLRKAVDDFCDNAVARNSLANLLARTERPEEAERLYRETIRLRRDRVAPQALAFWLLRWDRVVEAEELYWQIRDQFRENRYTRKLAEEISRRQGGWRGETEVPDFGVWKSAQETSEGGLASEGFVVSEEGEKSEPPPLEGHEVEGASTRARPPQYAEKSAVPGTVAEPKSVYDISEPERLHIDLDLYLLRNAEVGRADLTLRSGVNGSKRQEALIHVEKILDADPDHVYPRLILGLHETDWCRRLVEEVEAFHSAYPLRFLAARESRSDTQWDRLLSDFGEHYPWTLLGRLVAANGDGDPADAARLATWVVGGNCSRQGFEAFTAKRLERWLGDSPGVTEPTELLLRLTAHRREIEDLVGDALRRAADEGS